MNSSKNLIKSLGAICKVSFTMTKSRAKQKSAVKTKSKWKTFARKEKTLRRRSKNPLKRLQKIIERPQFCIRHRRSGFPRHELQIQNFAFRCYSGGQSFFELIVTPFPNIASFADVGGVRPARTKGRRNDYHECRHRRRYGQLFLRGYFR